MAVNRFTFTALHSAYKFLNEQQINGLKFSVSFAMQFLPKNLIYFFLFLGHEGTENGDQSKSSPTKDSGGGDGTTGDQSGAGPTGNEDSMNWADLKV